MGCCAPPKPLNMRLPSLKIELQKKGKTSQMFKMLHYLFKTKMTEYIKRYEIYLNSEQHYNNVQQKLKETVLNISRDTK